ncbi:MAG: lipoate--protein ligase [Bacteroidales bacterium]|nr:lipoate--protein ligase [Bacteroidales bacterium]MCF8390224.1 lipoate--protein ligase [Bacteroidales bacterium]
MLCIQNKITDPYFNIAAEEYVLKNFQDDCFMLYQNENSIIVGKHQNALSEINLDFVNDHQIKVVRRISGGGTVFHDLGNLNFSFFMTGEDGNLINFKKFTRPIIEFLKKNGLEAEYGTRNELMVHGKKISGNAEHIWKKKTLHHGTLLYSSDLSHLSGALKVNPLKYTDKSVKSVRSRVGNIIDYLPEKLDISVFGEGLMKHVMEEFDVPGIYEFSEEDIAAIMELRDNKFIRWDWNFGYSPSYIFEKSLKIKPGNLSVKLKATKGIITEIKLSGDFLEKDVFPDIEKILQGQKHDRTIMNEYLEEKYGILHGITANELLEVLF